MSRKRQAQLKATFLGCWICSASVSYSQGSEALQLQDAVRLSDINKQSQRNQAIVEFSRNQPVETLQVDSITSSNAGRKIIQDSSSNNAYALQQSDAALKNDNAGLIANAADSLRAAAQLTANKVPILLQNSATNLKFGSHNVVSSDGEDTIRLIRSLTVSDIQIPSTLRLLKEKQSAEALNFLGWVSETGSFGARVDLAQAQEYYSKAAKYNYQPAIYNLALGKAYGRFGQASPQSALPELARAFSIAKDDSGRVCGLASFLAHKVGNLGAAVSYARDCPSALGAFVLARYTDKFDFEERLRYLRNSIGTGADDGFPALLDAATAHAKSASDINFMTCKFSLMNAYRFGPLPANLKPFAKSCVDKRGGFRGASDGPLRDQAIAGIGAYVVGELSNLKALRAANKFRYSLPAPYLPFGQQEVNLFEKYLPLDGSKK